MQISVLLILFVIDFMLFHVGWKETVFSVAPKHLGHFLIHKHIEVSGKHRLKANGLPAFFGTELAEKARNPSFMAMQG